MYQKRNNESMILQLYLGDYKAQFYLREISKLAELPLKTTQNTVLSLEKDSILKSAVHGKNKYFKLNLDNIQTKMRLLQTEIQKTISFLEKYPQLKTFLKSITENNMIIIFGSFAKFTAEKNSDLDLLTVSGEIPTHLIPNKVHQIKLSENAFLKAVKQQETLIKEIEKNHVVLNNHSLYVNTMWSQYAK